MEHRIAFVDDRHDRTADDDPVERCHDFTFVFAEGVGDHTKHLASAHRITTAFKPRNSPPIGTRNHLLEGQNCGRAVADATPRPDIIPTDLRTRRIPT